MTNGLPKYDFLYDNNTFSVSSISGLRDINKTQWTQVPGPGLAAYSPLLK